MLTHMPSFTRSLTHSLSLTLPPPLEGMYACNALSLSLLLLLLLLSPPFSSTFSSLFLSLIMDGGGIGEEGGRRGGGEGERERGGEREWRTSKGEQRGVALKGRGVLHMYVLYYIYIAAVGREREREGKGRRGEEERGLRSFSLTLSLFPPPSLPHSICTHTHTHFAPSATWLILPVVICSAQRLSHACLSIRAFARNCERLITTVAI